MEPLARARQIADEIFHVTSTIVISGEEDMTEPEVDAYLMLIDDRQLLVDELVDIRPQLSSSELESCEFAQVKSILDDVRKLDSEHKAALNKLLSNVKTLHRDTKQKQVLNRAYAQISSDPISGGFDRSN